MKKKILSLVLALLMTASSASAILADDVAIADEEVATIAAIEEEVVAGQYDNAIKFLNQYGIFKGKSADDLGAEDMLERYQMALFVSRIATGWVDDEQWEDGPENWSEFTDISEGPVANYWGALSYANSQGIIEGYGNGKFGPTDGITYQNALTMVVRTLGYQGLEWPWGYIQKAVELGLTDGITGITYQDELNRGEVAQIIYNALFATTKSGSTLAMKSFGIEFGWEKVVITASDLDIYTKDSKDAKAIAVAKKTNGYKGFEKSNKTAPGYVAFKLLNDDGSLGDETYYMLASDIGLSTEAEAHDDEAVVGDAYYMLFEKDEDSDFVKTVAYESLLVDTIKNEGKTDDEGEEQDYAIQEFLADYKLVSKYTGKDYLNVTASGKNELLAYTATSIYTEYTEDGNYLAIDWTTGDILGVVYEDKDGDDRIDEDEIVKDEKGNYDYKVLWYYNEMLDKYYQFEIDEDYDNDDDDDIYYLNYMSDAEFEKTYKEFIKYAKSEHNGYKLIDKIGKSAYAELKLYDTNLDGVADRAIYEDYRLGKFYQDTVWCDHANLVRYNIENVTAFGQSDPAVKNQEGAVSSLTTVSAIAEGEDCGNNHKEDRVWFVEGYTPVAKYDEDGEFTGYAEGYVIYTVDKETGAIKVVKNIDDGSDIDSFVKTGVLRAYNLNKGTVTIDETQYSIKDYDELIGNAFRYVAKNYVTRAAYSDLFRSLFNQFVEYVVVDGEVVNVRAKSGTTSEAIVVESYAGLSSDGYIVVNGYSTEDLKYDQFRIGSYNGWVKGDCYYYLTEEKADDSFTKGTIYSIASYNVEEDVYYVNLAGSWNEDYTEYTIEEGVGKKYVKIVAGDDGYMTYTRDDKKENYRKMKSDDKYVIIPSVQEDAPFAPLYVYEGKLPEGSVVEGKRLNSDDLNNTTYVIYAASVNKELLKLFADTYKTGLVLLMDDAYIEADYNGADVEDDWYLLGASKFVVEGLNLLTGKRDEIYVATNLDLEVGHVYITQDGVAVEDNGVADIQDLVSVMYDAYPNNGLIDSDDAHYAYGTFIVDEENYTTIFDVLADGKRENKKALDALCGTGFKYLEPKTQMEGIHDYLGLDSYRDNIGGVKVYSFEYKNDKVDVAKVERLEKASQFEKLVKDIDKYNLPAFWVLDTANNDLVIYIDFTDGNMTVISDKVEYTNPVKVWETNVDDAEAYIEAQLGYTTTTVDGTVVSATLDGMLLTFGGHHVETATHDIIRQNNWYFGYEEACTYEDIVSTIQIQWLSGDVEFDKVRAYIVEGTYGECIDDCECKDDMVKSVYIPFAVVGTKDGKVDLKDVVITAEESFVEVTLKDAVDVDNGLVEDEVKFTVNFVINADKSEDTVFNGFTNITTKAVVYTEFVELAK